MRGGNQKDGPCEGADAKTPVTLRSGSTLKMRITETIGHEGHFRILLDTDINNGENFPVQQSCDELVVPENLPSDIKLLKDHVLPAPGKHCGDFDTPGERTAISNTEYDVTVTLPDIECENCAIQVIQVMTDKGDVEDGWSNIPKGKGLYFRCADVRLSANDPVDEDPGDSSPDHDHDEDTLPTNSNDSGCLATAADSYLFALLLIGLCFVALRKRRPTRDRR